MNRDQKRFTISVTPELAAELTAVKQSSYPGVPRDAMFRDLIIRGLAAWEKQSGKNVTGGVPGPIEAPSALPANGGRQKQTETR